MNQLHNRLGQSDWYMAWYQNNDVLKNSSSGGAFTAIAEVVLQNGGVVLAHIMIKKLGNYITKRLQRLMI